MRWEILQKKYLILGVKYIGVCCGASPMHIREVAEAIGLKFQQADLGKI